MLLLTSRKKVTDGDIDLQTGFRRLSKLFVRNYLSNEMLQIDTVYITSYDAVDVIFLSSFCHDVVAGTRRVKNRGNDEIN